MKIKKHFSRTHTIGRLLLLILILALSFGNVAGAVDVNPEQQRDVLFPLYSDVACSGPNCGCSGTTSLVGADNAEKVWNYFIAKGLEPHLVAGMLGNFARESGINPIRIQGAGNRESQDPNDAGSLGWGLMQWTPGSKIIGLMEQAGITTPVYELGSQLDLVWWHLNNTSPTGRQNVIEGFRQQTTVEGATDYFEEYMEGAGNPALAERRALANDYFARFGSGTGPAPTSGGNSCGVSLDGCPTGVVGLDQMVNVRGINVHPCIAEELERILSLAEAQGLDMSGSGWRSTDDQVTLRGAHGCGGSRIYDRTCRGHPPTAVPGSSRHERGTAVDFTCNGQSIETRSHPCFVFLRDNTSLQNLDSEPWHWSNDGS